MSNQPRVVKVLAALLFSMTAGAIVLMSLGQNPPAEGPWSLSKSLRSDSTLLSANSITPKFPSNWDRIEVCYSGTASGNIELLAELTGVKTPAQLNCHFVVCNGRGGVDGQALLTEKWLQQLSITPDQGWQGGRTVIRICVVSDGRLAPPTGEQISQTNTLVKKLREMFDISEQHVLYPMNWRL